MVKNKKEKFLQRSNNQLYIIAGVLIIIIIGAIFLLISGNNGVNQINISGGNLSSASGAQVQEVSLTPRVTSDKIIIKKSEVELLTAIMLK